MKFKVTKDLLEAKSIQKRIRDHILNAAIDMTKQEELHTQLTGHYIFTEPKVIPDPNNPFNVDFVKYCVQCEDEKNETRRN